MTLAETRYRDKVRGGWLGKLIGVALGAPVDGQRQTHEFTPTLPEGLRYPRQPSCSATGIPLAWLRALHRTGPRLADGDLASAWLAYITCAEWECAYARRNLCRALPPPVCGAFDNPFRRALGGMARADLWGLVTPGDPERATRYAHQDASLDHSGPGVEAACLVAAMVSAAFVESDPARALEIALSLLPAESRVARAVRDVIRWHGELAHWTRTREMLLRSHGSEEVRDAVVAAGLVALALVHERGDFARTVVTAANCGWSTESVCGAAGAVAGVLAGESGIPPEWRGVLPAALAPHVGVALGEAPLSVAAIADRTAQAGRLVVRSECQGRVQLSEGEVEDPGSLGPQDGTALIRHLGMGPYVACFRREPLEIHVDYEAGATVGYDAPRRLILALTNLGPRELDLQVRISGPPGFVVSANAGRMALPEGGQVSFTVTVTAPEGEAVIGAVNPFTLFVAIEDGPEVVAPIALVGESLWYAAGPYGSFDETHAPEQSGVLSGETALGGEGWQRLSVAEPAVNVLAGLEGDQGTYYLATDLLAPRAQRARLRVGCNDGTRVWLNGEETYWQHEHRAVAPTSAGEFEVNLREGWNRLVIKMAQCSPRRILSVALRGLDRHLLTEVANTQPRG